MKIDEPMNDAAETASGAVPPEIDLDADAAASAARVLEKLRAFVASLDEQERGVLAALLAPGVASAYAESDKTDAEVLGFGMHTWSPERLPDALAARIRSERVRVEFD